MELPNEIWDMIVKQSTETVEDKIKKMSLNEMSLLMYKLEKIKEKKLIDKWNDFLLYTIIVDNCGSKFMVCKKNISKKRYIILRRVEYHIFNNHNMFGGYCFCPQSIYTNQAIMDLETDKIVSFDNDTIKVNDMENNSWLYIYKDFTTVSEFVSIKQKQLDIDNKRISYANSLKVNDWITYYSGRLSDLGDCYFTPLNFDNINSTQIKKFSNQYIFYEQRNEDKIILKRIDKKYIVIP